jgi:hypothetical protein
LSYFCPCGSALALFAAPRIEAVGVKLQHSSRSPEMRVTLRC